jgi:hypothetical protein
MNNFQDYQLMYTKQDRLKNSHYAQAICAVVADLKKLTIPAVVGRSEQLPTDIEVGKMVSDLANLADDEMER